MKKTYNEDEIPLTLPKSRSLAPPPLVAQAKPDGGFTPVKKPSGEAVKRVQVESDVLNGASWPASLPLAKPPTKSPALRFR